MAAEPTKAEIQAVFKRLRASPTNKVRRRRELRGCRVTVIQQVELQGPG